MTLAAGTKLGSYEVLSQIGAGGMGEVYQAHDTKLGRDVAIKVLPQALEQDAERLARFQREAKMLAALNHPNIATIYGLEDSGNKHYLVMELVPGETLADRIKREGAVPVEEALTVCKQIAEALEAAHEKNIIHRDLKPANVKVTPEGKVKVLDFGLAKAFEGDPTATDMSNSPTLSMAATMQGVILGTAAYMSPEQARGKSVDKRTDIWAFGAVLYELLTGEKAFHGEDVGDILAAVIRAEPDWSSLPPSTPTKIRELIRRCLQKDKILRMRDAGDARIEIQEALVAQSAEPTTPANGLLKLGRRAVLLGVGALVMVAAIAGFTVWNLRPVPPRPVTRTVINLPPGDQLAALDFPAIALSPDGTQLAYVAIHSGTRQIYLRALDSLDAKPLAGTQGATTPFFSPDGQSLGFFAGGKLEKISISGGAAVALTSAASGNPHGASWGGQGSIFFTSASGAILQVPDAGGVAQPLTHMDTGESAYWPVLLPGGKAILFETGGNNSQISVRSLGGGLPAAAGQQRNLVPGGTFPQYASSGHLLYAQGSNLTAVPFDPRRLQIMGAAVPVVDGVLPSQDGGMQFSISATGSLAYIPGVGQATNRRLVWVGRNGKEQALAAPPNVYGFPRLSPDGRRLTVTLYEAQDTQLWVYDLARETLTRLTFGGNLDQNPAWTPDGKRVAFFSSKGGNGNLFWQLTDGSGGLERLTTSENIQVPRSFSPDGQLLAFIELNTNTGYDISVLHLNDRKAQPFLHTPFNESVPSFSPDGHWMAYISDESARYEVYVQPYPGPGGKYQISTGGGTEPVWNPNGKELFYRSGDKMMAVDVTTQPSFSVGNPRMLFQGSYMPSTATFPYYDVSPDGQRFLMIKPSEQETPLTQIVVVQNWTEELKRKVPTGGK